MLVRSAFSALVALVLSFAFFLGAATIVQADAGTAADPSEAPQHLAQANAALSSGRYADALAAFDLAIAADPTSYLTYYRRATAALSLGRTSSALADLEKLLELNPGFAKAHFQRAKVLAKEGELEEAKRAVDKYLTLNGSDMEAKQLQGGISQAIGSLGSLHAAANSVMKGLKEGKTVATDKQLAARTDDCVRYAAKVLEVAPSHLESRSKRAECWMAKGDLEEAVGDWR